MSIFEWLFAAAVFFGVVMPVLIRLRFVNTGPFSGVLFGLLMVLSLAYAVGFLTWTVFG